MRQQINLIKALPKHERVWLPLKRMKQICLGFVVLLALLYAFAVWQNIHLSGKHEEVIVKEKNMLEDIKALAEKHPREEVDTEIQQQVKKLEAQLRSNQEILVLLKASKALNLVGFSQYLEALTQAIPVNAWLTHITITQAGEKVDLQGKSYDSHTVLSFVDRLNKNKLFKDLDLTFRLVKVKRGEPSADGEAAGQPVLYDFTITTSEDDEDIA